MSNYEPEISTETDFYGDQPITIPLILLIPGAVIVMATLLMILVLQIDTIVINVAAPQGNTLAPGV